MHRSGDPPSYLLNPPLTFHISAIPVLLILNRPRSSSHSGHDSALDSRRESSSRANSPFFSKCKPEQLSHVELVILLRPG